MEAVTVETIAEAVAPTETEICWHCSSKRKIPFQLITDMGNDLFPGVALVQSEEPNALNVLQCILETHLADSAGYRGVSFIVVADAIRLEGGRLFESVQEMQDQYLESIKDVMCQGVTEGEFRADRDVDAGTFTVLGMMQGTATIGVLIGNR